MLVGCLGSGPGPVLSRSLPPPPAALTADRPLPAIRAGQDAGAVIAQQRAAAADERRRRAALAAWYDGVRRSYGEAR